MNDQKCQFIVFFFLYSILLHSSCKAQDNKGQAISDIAGRVWLRSHEEDTDGLKAFRSQGYEFPPARGREGFELDNDGTFIYYSIAPTDGIQKNKGTWTAKENEIRVTFPEDKSLKKELFFEIEGYKNGLLTIEEKETKE